MHLAPSDSQRRAPNSVAHPLRPFWDPQVGVCHRAGAHRNGVVPQLFNECQYDLCVMVISADVVRTRPDEHSTPDRQEREDARSDAHLHFSAHGLLHYNRADHARMDLTGVVIGARLVEFE